MVTLHRWRWLAYKCLFVDVAWLPLLSQVDIQLYGGLVEFGLLLKTGQNFTVFVCQKAFFGLKIVLALTLIDFRSFWRRYDRYVNTFLLLNIILLRDTFLLQYKGWILWWFWFSSLLRLNWFWILPVHGLLSDSLLGLFPSLVQQLLWAWYSQKGLPTVWLNPWSEHLMRRPLVTFLSALDAWCWYFLRSVYLPASHSLV
jgi:hypothetical protein